MQKRAKRDTTLCRSFCTYYKPDRNEDLACQGFVVVQRIIESGKALPQERPAETRSPDARSRRALETRVCGRCSFREQDCDYAATGGEAPACGGFQLLAHLLATGELTPDEIE